MGNDAEIISAAVAVAAFAFSVVSLLTSLRRARQDKTDQDIAAVVKQVRALELDIASKYAPRDQIEQQIEQVAKRLEQSVRDLMTKFDKFNEDLIRFFRDRSQ